ncbi:MAG: four helix bundle protein [Vicinamibacterales bacterium]|jgi:four helix bundle protein|nr:four helix bundle protein [Vicinamibacterales bacterium]HJN44065.1 four helix bundle protein [Vicinamibacterales bacterium]|tara:strand:+ start:23 stop:394 length:372 start_codon:yes stop_codon:yes gene_type:complete
MSRDPRKLRVFGLADTLVVDVYRATRPFPTDERYGLQAQIRRAAVSTVANIVEGSAMRTTKEYRRFLNVSLGSAAEARYLVDLAERLSYVPEPTRDGLVARFTVLMKCLQNLIFSLERPKPKA